MSKDLKLVFYLNYSEKINDMKCYRNQKVEFYKDYQHFNGSYFNNGDFKYLAWRCQKKPEFSFHKENKITPPTYPYITKDGNWDIDENLQLLKFDINGKCLKPHTYKHHGQFPAEDPRIYRKRDGQLYVMYTAVADCKINDRCIGLWEKKIEAVDAPIMICESVGENVVEAKNIFDDYKHYMYKNFSYDIKRDIYYDGYGKMKEFTPSVCVFNKKCCIKKEIGIELNKFSDEKGWKFSLTTPTISGSFGVIHVRIPWVELSRNYDKLKSSGLKRMIKKFDVHHDDCYLMSIYRLKNKKISITAPFMVSGHECEKYLTYNINFPCGLNIDKDTFNIDFGIGDCVFSTASFKLTESALHEQYHKFKYKDLLFFGVKDDMFLREPIYKTLNYVESYPYLLPRHIMCFDLGGSGLKFSKVRTGNLIKFGNEYNLGQWDENTKPDINKMLKNGIKNYEKNQKEVDMYINCLLFSLADIDKFYTKRVRKKNKSIWNNEVNYDMHNFLNIPKHIPVYQISDAVSHYYGNWYELTMSKGINFSEPIVSIAIGTGIAVSFGIGTKIYKDVKTPMWKLKNIKKIINPDSKEDFFQGINSICNNFNTTIKGGHKHCDFNIMISGKKGFSFNKGFDTSIVGENLRHIKINKTNIFFNGNPHNVYRGLLTYYNIKKDILSVVENKTISVVENKTISRDEGSIIPHVELSRNYDELIEDELIENELRKLERDLDLYIDDDGDIEMD